MTETKLVNGQRVELTVHEASLRATEVADATTEAAARAARLAQLLYRIQRKDLYAARLADEPENDLIDTIGDCLDALFKDAQWRREAGETLHPDLVTKLDAWLQVKAEVPSPQ